MKTVGARQGAGMTTIQQDDNRVWTGGHTLDARYRLPWFGGPIYLRIMVGRERRPVTRSEEDAARSIRRSVATFLFFTLGACLFYTVAAVLLLIGSAVLE
ncbi:MAG: hypothetical protein JJ878_18180 [Alphaproteobacteria bacterium]|nr:hypothetical protein [Alphaproteobacteria bacterium]MBO6864568.1 hypothetical protein [Alphaproteobacteria bacterium]